MNHLIQGPKGHEFAQEALKLMARHEVDPTPDNYQVWIAYVVGSPADVKKDIDGIVKRGAGFDAKVCSQLHTKHFRGEQIDHVLARTGGALSDQLSKVAETLKNAGDDTAEYGRTLEGASDELSGAQDAESLRSMVDRLFKATHDMEQRSHVLESQLKESSDEVAKLRVNLEQVRAEALTDGLTGVANRKRFDEELAVHANAIDAGMEGDLCLLLGDIDFFKRFNDTWGHQTGDHIIRFVATTMQKCAEQNHLVARYGGEEFAMILPGADIEKAAAIGERIRGLVESKRLIRKSTQEDLGSVTISMGVALFRKGEEVREFIERADACLYASKKGGRNKVTPENAISGSKAA